MSRQARVHARLLRSSWSPEALAFANGLIQRKRHRRLGENGLKELKAHAWLAGFRWKYLANQILRPEFVPRQKTDNFISRHVNRRALDTDPELGKVLRKKSFQALFSEYFYRELPGQRREECPSLVTRRSESLD